MSQPPNGTIFAPSARWAPSNGEVERSIAGTVPAGANGVACRTLVRVAAAVTWQANLFGFDVPRPDESFLSCNRVALDGGAWVDHALGWLAGSDTLFAELVDTAPWRQRTRHMY